MSTAVVQIEGVLQQDNQKLSYVSRPPLQPGMTLWTAITRAYRAMLMTEETEEDKVRWWIQSQGVRDFANILMPPPAWAMKNPEDRVRLQIKALRAAGTDVGLVVVSNPAVAAVLLQDGVPVSLYCHPRFARPEYRPGGFKGIRPWADIEAEVDEQKRLINLPRPDTAEVVR